MKLNERCNTMKKYKLYDILEGTELLGEYDNMLQVRDAMEDRWADTDGEWLPRLLRLNKNTGEYDKVF